MYLHAHSTISAALMGGNETLQPRAIQCVRIKTATKEMIYFFNQDWGKDLQQM